MQPAEVEELRRLVRAASGCIGPCGRSRAVRTSDSDGARTIVTSSCAAVLHSWPVPREHHVLRLVVDTAEAHLRRHRDAGWLFLNFCLRVTLTLRGLGLVGSCDEEPAHSHTAALHGLALASSWLEELLEDATCACRRKLDWSELPSVLALLRSTLCKPVALSSAGEVRHLSITILDAFLGSLPSLESGDDGDVSLRYSWFCGLDLPWSSAFRGLVLDTPAALASEPRRSAGSQHLVLFDVSLEQWLPGAAEAGHQVIGLENYKLELTGGDEGINEFRRWELSQFRRLADELLEAGVNILACQKLVDPWLVDYLLERGVSVLSRLSLRHVDAVRRFSGAVPVTSLAALPKKWGAVMGVVGPLEEKTISQRKYTFVHAPHESSAVCGRDVTTLLLGAPDDHALAELRRCVPQAVHSLQDAAHSGAVLLGGGLTEVLLADALIDRARRAIADGAEAAAGSAVLAIAECLQDVAACLHADTRGESRGLLHRDSFLEAARKACKEPGDSAFAILEAQSPKKYALLGALDLAGILVRLGGTLDLVNTTVG